MFTFKSSALLFSKSHRGLTNGVGRNCPQFGLGSFVHEYIVDFSPLCSGGWGFKRSPMGCVSLHIVGAVALQPRFIHAFIHS